MGHGRADRPRDLHPGCDRLCRPRRQDRRVRPRPVHRHPVRRLGRGGHVPRHRRRRPAVPRADRGQGRALVQPRLRRRPPQQRDRPRRTGDPAGPGRQLRRVLLLPHPPRLGRERPELRPARTLRLLDSSAARSSSSTRIRTSARVPRSWRTSSSRRSCWSAGTRSSCRPRAPDGCRGDRRAFRSRYHRDPLRRPGRAGQGRRRLATRHRRRPLGGEGAVRALGRGRGSAVHRVPGGCVRPGRAHAGGASYRRGDRLRHGRRQPGPGVRMGRAGQARHPSGSGAGG